MSIQDFRALFPITRERIYLANGGVTPAADPVLLAVRAWIDAWESDPLKTYYELEQVMADLRRSFAELIGATSATVSLTDNTSRASNIAVRGLAHRPGAEVLVDAGTYPSSVLPWLTMTNKVVRTVPWDRAQNPTEAVISEIGPETSAVTISHVDSRSGERHDLRALSAAVHNVGGVLVVDAAQSAGVVPLDVDAEGVDVLTCTARKWLLGLPGVGFLYARPGLLGETGEIGHLSFDRAAQREDSEVPTLWPDGRRFELGPPSLPGIVAAQAGIELLLGIGIDEVASVVSDLVLRCIEQCLETGLALATSTQPSRRAGIVVVRHAEAESMSASLRRRRIDTGFLRPGLLRIDPHAFNTLDEVDACCAALAAWLSDRRAGRALADT